MDEVTNMLEDLQIDEQYRSPSVDTRSNTGSIERGERGAYIPAPPYLFWKCRRNNECTRCKRQYCNFQGECRHCMECEVCGRRTLFQCYSARVCSNKECVYFTETPTWFYCPDCMSPFESGCPTCDIIPGEVDIGLLMTRHVPSMPLIVGNQWLQLD